MPRPPPGRGERLDLIRKAGREPLEPDTLNRPAERSEAFGVGPRKAADAFGKVRADFDPGS